MILQLLILTQGVGSTTKRYCVCVSPFSRKKRYCAHVSYNAVTFGPNANYLFV